MREQMEEKVFKIENRTRVEQRGGEEIKSKNKR